MKRWLLMLAGVLLLIAVIGSIKYYSVQKMIAGYAAMGEPTATVSTVKAAYAEWQPTLTAVGTARAVRGVDLAMEVSGVVESLNFRSGGYAAKGALLAQLVVDADLARLHALEADAALAKITGDRAVKLLEAKAISQAQADTDRAKLKSAEAAVAEQQALVLRKSIHAPFAGQLGITRINPGQYMNPGDKLVTLQQLDPIHVDFTLPQSTLGQLAPGMEVVATTDAFPGMKFSGDITAINPVVDAETRNIRVQATLKNPQQKLLPGMFANLAISAGAPQRYLTLPQNAVAFNPYGETVFVIVERGQENAEDPNKPAELAQSEALKSADEDLKAEANAKAGQHAPQQHPAASDDKQQLVARQLFIGVGPTRGDQIAITSGLKEGDEVVTSGQLKLKNGTLVVINNAVQPKNAADPRPIDD